MAKLTAPLMSFNARGKLAGSLVFMGWKGLKTVRQYVTPANPRTPDQVAQRNLFTQAVFAWRNYFTTEETNQAWDVAANVAPDPLSGFNIFMRNALALLGLGGDKAIASAVVTGGGLGIIGTMVNVEDGTTSTDGSTFDLLLGTKESSLLPVDSQIIVAGNLDFSAPAPFLAGDVVFAQIRGDNVERSGITKLTLQA